MPEHNYKWEFDHPKKYKRLTAKDISDEGAMKLTEIILGGLHDEIEYIVSRLGGRYSLIALDDAVDMEKRMTEDWFNVYTMGNAAEVRKIFVQQCEERSNGRYGRYKEALRRYSENAELEKKERIKRAADSKAAESQLIAN